MSKKKLEKDTRLFMRISTELKTKIELKAKEQNLTKSKLISEAIKNYLDK
jgi:predicted DNA binding CopG/RHH family protein